jgi:hypothetical protein
MNEEERPNFNFDLDVAKFTPKQLEATLMGDSGKKKYILYGGALGGGKSYWLRWYCVRRLMQIFWTWGQFAPVGMLACEDYPSLKDRQISKISREFPSWLGDSFADHRDYGRCFILKDRYGGGILCFRNLDDSAKYASAEFCIIGVDELTKNSLETFTFLRSRLRWPGVPDIHCQFVAGTNPGSVGHGWVKNFWIKPQFPDEWIKPIDYRSQFGFVKSLADDNEHLPESYWQTLETLPEPIRSAFRYGNWDIFLGQAFPEFSTEKHVVLPKAIPVNAPIYMTMDWGFGAPFSIGWWWLDADNRAYRFAEWYGYTGTPNQGLRLSDTEIALGIIEREKVLKLDGYNIQRWAGPDCFQKRPDYRGGGQGPSTAEVFASLGLYLIAGDANRQLKIRAFRERLREPAEGEMPMLVVYRSCKQFIRTIPDLVMDENNIEDVDTDGEDHIYDEACHLAMGRPLSMEKKKPKLSESDQRLIALERGSIDPTTRMLIEEQHIAMKYFDEESLDEEWLKPTIF